MINHPGGKQLANAAEFGELIGMSERWVQQATRDGKIPCRRPVDAKVFYLLPDDLEVFLARIADDPTAAA